VSAIPTKRVATTLKYQDGSLLELESVEFFSNTKMIWIRGGNLRYEGLQEAVVEGVKFEVASVEDKGDHLLEVRFER